MADLGLSSVMDQSGRDAHGATLSSNSKESFRRLAIWDKKSRSKQSKGMHIPLTVLQNISSNLGLPNTVEEDIAYQFRKCVSLGIHKKIGRKKLVPVIVYITCRKLNIPRTLQDVADASNVSKRILRRNYSKTILELGLNPELVRPSTLIPRIATSIGLKEKVSRFAVQIASQYENTRYSLGKNPCGIAGACVYLSCIKFGIEIPQVEICNIAGTSSVTIRNVSKSIRLALPHLIIVQRVTNKKLR
jgi:transcription initiation factor TFIIB